MTVRIVRWCGIAAVALSLTGPAVAREAESGGVAVSGTGMTLGTLLASGLGTPALQRGAGLPGAGPLVSTNTQVSNNLAAGLGNGARQQVAGAQTGLPAVGLDLSGRGPLVTTNVDVGTNVAAGLGNLANQTLAAPQR